MSLRGKVIEVGFGVIGATRLHRAAAPFLRGVGAILMFHHVRPAASGGFAPNSLLEITPDFLDATIGHLLATGYEVITLDDAVRRLQSPRTGAKPFAVLTFDDGYRDSRDHALPVLERYGAPATFFVTTGFADRTARLWWKELEEAIRAATRVELTLDGEAITFDAGDDRKKQAAYEALYWRLRALPEQTMLDGIATLCGAQGIGGRALVEAACMDWSELETFARHPLVSIGAHTLTHPMLAKHSASAALHEMRESKATLERRLGRAIRHFAYPVGDPTSAGAREFAAAAACGFDSAVTTRPGVLFPEHGGHLTGLPRLSVNGNHQRVGNLDILLSGTAFALWNRGRRLNVA